MATEQVSSWMLQRVKLSPNVPFYWVIIEAASLCLRNSYLWDLAIGGIEKGVDKGFREYESMWVSKL